MAARACRSHNGNERDFGGRGKKLIIGGLFLAGEFSEFADCGKCKESPDLKKERGCEGDLEIPLIEIDGVGELKRCPARMLVPDVRKVMGIYHHYKNGFLPVAGGLLNQSATFIAAIAILDSTVNRVHQDNIDKARKNGNR